MFSYWKEGSRWGDGSYLCFFFGYLSHVERCGYLSRGVILVLRVNLVFGVVILLVGVVHVFRMGLVVNN